MTKNDQRRENCGNFPKVQAKKLKKLGRALSAIDIEWRVWLGLSPNPWGRRRSAGFETLQIITSRGPSSLERRSSTEVKDE